MPRAAQAGSRALGQDEQGQGWTGSGPGRTGGRPTRRKPLADLEDAEEQVAEARKELEEQLAMEQLAKMGDELKALSERQGKMVEDITNYETLRAKREGSLTIAQRNGVRNLGRVQQGLKDESAGLAEKLEGAPGLCPDVETSG